MSSSKRSKKRHWIPSGMHGVDNVVVTDLYVGERYMLKRGVLPSAFPWSPAPKRVPSTSQVKPAATTKDGVKKEKVKDTIRPKQERLSNSPPPLVRFSITLCTTTCVPYLTCAKTLWCIY